MSIKVKRSLLQVLIALSALINTVMALANDNLDLFKSTPSQSQLLNISAIQTPAAVDQNFIFDINYNHSPALNVKTLGVSFRLHWDSSQLAYQSVSNLLNDNFIKQSEVLYDSLDYDNDTETDVYILFTWLDVTQQWPTSGFSPTLMTANFKTTLNYVGTTVKLSEVTSLPDMELSPGVYAHWDMRVQNLTIGTAPNNLYINGFEAAPTYLPQNIFSGDDTLCSTDIDGNGILEPLTDGVLVSRFINGITDTSLIHGALGQGAVRTTAAEVVSFLQMSDCQVMLDIDANGVIEPGFDDVLFARYLFGYNGNDLTENALGTDFQRGGITDLHTWFETYSYFRTVTLDETVAVGSQATSSDGNVTVEPIDNDVSVNITTGVDEDGDLVYQVSANGSGAVEFTFDGMASDRNTVTECYFEEPEDDYPVNTFNWGEPNCAYYLDGISFDFNRIPNSRMLNDRTVLFGLVFGVGPLPDLFNVKYKTSSQLTSSCRQLSQDGCLDKKPVLFIHGFSPDSGLNYTWPLSGLGGGKGTWGKFPELLEQLGYTPFEFRWRTSAKFEDVAAELVEAVKQIKQLTKQEVNIVAHSFGGILTRTMMQGLAHDVPNFDIQNIVDKVVTVGTPHSGIADNNMCLNGKVFPQGQASLMFESCQQISCHQMGEETISLPGSQIVFDVGETGSLMNKLACLTSDNENCNAYHPLIDGDFLVLIGLKRYVDLFNGGAMTVDVGDGLISYEGQRFIPELTSFGTCVNGDSHPVIPFRPLESIINYSAATVRERMLGTTSMSVFPGGNQSLYHGFGYKHSSINGALNASEEEVELDCSNVNTCPSPTLKYVRDFFGFLTVSIEQASTQVDPTSSNVAYFDVLFNKEINSSTLLPDDFTVYPSGEVISVAIDSSNNKLWQIQISNITDGDTITVTMDEGQVEDTYGNGNEASTSNDNQVTYNTPPLYVSSMNDTGVKHSAGELLDNCNSLISTQEDCYHGRDTSHNDDSDGQAGFSFAKLDGAGAELPLSAQQWSCVRDNVSGLTWAIKTDDGGLHDKDHIYTWYNPDNDSNGGDPGSFPAGEPGNGIINSIHGYVEDVNLVGLCGLNNWRVPEVGELFNVIDFVGGFGALESNFFPNNQELGGAYWTYTPLPSGSSDAFAIDFSSTFIHNTFKDNALHVRLVSNGGGN